jgi:hypothetical protein
VTARTVKGCHRYCQWVHADSWLACVSVCPRLIPECKDEGGND